MSGLVRARGLKRQTAGLIGWGRTSGLVRARGLKQIGLDCPVNRYGSGLVRARGLKLITLIEKHTAPLSGLVRARGLKLRMKMTVPSITVRARKSPWIETLMFCTPRKEPRVRARKSPWIETIRRFISFRHFSSGLVRARGLKQKIIKEHADLHCQGS